MILCIDIIYITYINIEVVIISKRGYEFKIFFKLFEIWYLIRIHTNSVLDKNTNISYYIKKIYTIIDVRLRMYI